MLTKKEAIHLIINHFREAFSSQFKTVFWVVSYLIAFQVLILQNPIESTIKLAAGLFCIVTGLAFFMEGLKIGLMPLGEKIGSNLPNKVTVKVTILIAFIVGILATLAEPAIGTLKFAGSSVKAWNAPTLFQLLNNKSQLLVTSVAIGVGFAVALGILRFLLKWSLKPMIYVFVFLVVGLTFLSSFEDNLLHISSLAWDCGAVTTGPVTVPLVLSLGLGISRIVHDEPDSTEGFGLVTLASLAPIFSVLILGIVLTQNGMKPVSESDFYDPTNRSQALELFADKTKFQDYALVKTSDYENRLNAFDGDQEELTARWNEILSNPTKYAHLLPVEASRLSEWWATHASNVEKAAVNIDSENLAQPVAAGPETGMPSHFKVLLSAMLTSLQAILPLTLLLLFVLKFIIKEKMQYRDEIYCGILFGIIGLTLFNLGLSNGLTNLGSNVGKTIPVAYKAIPAPENRIVIENFNENYVYKAKKETGGDFEFFYHEKNGELSRVPFKPESFSGETGTYDHTPVKGPIFRADNWSPGIIVILFFAFLLGLTATLAEPALNALGQSVEQITVGTFKKSHLISTVAFGVGIGTAFGIAKILFNIPLYLLLGIPYAILLVMTYLSTEEFVNIAWDSAGVTTGPVTVPLAIALGLGISAQEGVVEGFGILASASVYPIMAVLTMGLIVTARRRRELKELEEATKKEDNPMNIQAA